MAEYKVRRKILVVNPFPIFPPVSGGQSRVFNLSKNLAAYHDVIVLCLSDRREYREIAFGLKQISVPKSLAHCKTELTYYQALRFTTCAIMPLISHLTPEFSCVLRSLANSASIIILSHPFLYDEIKKLNSSLPLVYDAHNVEINLASQLFPPEMSSLLDEISRVESCACRDSQLITTCSLQDAFTLSELYHIELNKFFEIPNGANTEANPFSDRHCLSNKISPPSVLFMGSNHPPNHEASLVVLKIARQLPNINFLFLGSLCNYFNNLLLPNNVKLLGVLPETEKQHILNSVDIALNPILSGSGTNIKMLDYMASGIPVITTKFGARGIAGNDGEHFVVCEPVDMAAEIIDLLHDEKRAELISRQAFSLAANQYSWKKISANFICKIAALIC